MVDVEMTEALGMCISDLSIKIFFKNLSKRQMVSAEIMAKQANWEKDDCVGKKIHSLLSFKFHIFKKHK